MNNVTHAEGNVSSCILILCIRYHSNTSASLPSRNYLHSNIRSTTQCWSDFGGTPIRNYMVFKLLCGIFVQDEIPVYGFANQHKAVFSRLQVRQL